MIRPLAAALLAAAPLPATAVAPEPEGAGVPTGAKPRECLNPRLIRSTRVIDERTVLFRVGQQWYRNDLPNGGCAGLRPDRAFSYRTSVNSLCSIDVIQVFEPSTGMSFGSCGLGKFTPVKLAGR